MFLQCLFLHFIWEISRSIYFSPMIILFITCVQYVMLEYFSHVLNFLKTLKIVVMVFNIWNLFQEVPRLYKTFEALRVFKMSSKLYKTFGSYFFVEQSFWNWKKLLKVVWMTHNAFGELSKKLKAFSELSVCKIFYYFRFNFFNYQTFFRSHNSSFYSLKALKLDAVIKSLETRSYRRY